LIAHFLVLYLACLNPIIFDDGW